MSGYVQSNQIVRLPELVAYSINASDSGKIMITPQTSGTSFIYTLPLGLHYRFINGATLALNGYVEIATSGGVGIYGSVICGPDNGMQFKSIQGDLTITFQSGTSIEGDFIDLVSDGITWYLDGRSQTAGGIL